MNAATVSPQFDDRPVPTRLKLSALWVSVMFLYVYVDILGFYEPGTITGILEGRVWVLEITQTWAVAALVLMAIPSLMVSISLMAPVAFVRWTNLSVAGALVVVSIGNAVGESWAYYWIGAALETVLLLIVIRCAWTSIRPVAKETPVTDRAT